MANLHLDIGNRRYDLFCADGEEPHLRALGAIVDAKAMQARQVVGDLNESRQLLFAALFLADELSTAQRRLEAGEAAASPAAAAPADDAALERIAARLERLADSL